MYTLFYVVTNCKVKQLEREKKVSPFQVQFFYSFKYVAMYLLSTHTSTVFNIY